MVVGVDVDNVIIDIMTPWLRMYNTDWVDALRHEDMLHWDMKANVKYEAGREIYEYLHDPALYAESTPEEKGALEAVERIHRRGNEIVYITHNVDHGMHDAKVAWMRKKGFLALGELWGAVGSAKKTRLSVDAMIDDKPETVQQFVQTGRIGVIFTQPWNVGYDFSLRINGWEAFDGDLLTFALRSLKR